MQNPSPRFDIYALIHKALRAQMSHALCEVGRTDWDDSHERDATLATVRELLGVCHGHLEHEETYLHPAIEAAEPRGRMLADSDHGRHQAAMETLFDLIAVVERATPSMRQNTGERLYRELALFVADNFEHMAFEEREHNRMLWSAYTDAEIHDIHRELVSSIPPAKMMETLRWMVPYSTAQERAQLLGGMLHTAPPGAFNAVMSMLQGTLRSNDMQKLTRALLTQRASEAAPIHPQAVPA